MIQPPGIQPTLTTVAATADVFNLDRLTVINLHCIPTQQVRDILTQRTRAAAAGKADRIRVENAARTEFITRQRGAR